MKNDLKHLIFERIEDNHLSAFSCFDFIDLANYKTISKCLERMEDDSIIKRAITGIYYLSNNVPSIDDVCNSIAKKHRWNICPTGIYALNVFGLSTQVPVKYVYLSSGPYKNYSIFGVDVVFKRTSTREIVDYSPISLLLIQCIKTLGKDNITEEDIIKLRNRIPEKEKINILKETTFVQTWIRNVILKVCR